MIDLKEIAKTMTKEEFVKKHIINDSRGHHVLYNNIRYECPDELGLRVDSRCEYDIEYQKYCGECWDRGLLKLEFKEADKDIKFNTEKNTYTLQEIYEISNSNKDRVTFKSIDDGLTMFFDNDDLWAISGELCGRVPLTMKHMSGRYIIVEEENLIQLPEALEQLQEGKTIRSKVTNNQYNIVNGILHRNGMPLLPKHTSSILYEEIIGEWVVM